MQRPPNEGGKEHQHKPCKRNSSSSAVRLSVKHSGHIAYKKLQTMPRHRRKCSGTERLPVVTQADGMAFYRWKSKGYHGGAYIDI